VPPFFFFFFFFFKCSLSFVVGVDEVFEAIHKCREAFSLRGSRRNRPSLPATAFEIDPHSSGSERSHGERSLRGHTPREKQFSGRFPPIHYVLPYPSPPYSSGSRSSAVGGEKEKSSAAERKSRREASSSTEGGAAREAAAQELAARSGGVGTRALARLLGAATLER